MNWSVLNRENRVNMGRVEATTGMNKLSGGQ
jgi:hypothetical protein